MSQSNSTQPNGSVYQAYSGNTFLFGGNAPYVEELFGSSRYKEVAEAYISGLEALAAQGKEIKNVMSNSFGFGGNCTSLIFSKA